MDEKPQIITEDNPYPALNIFLSGYDGRPVKIDRKYGLGDSIAEEYDRLTEKDKSRNRSNDGPCLSLNSTFGILTKENGSASAP